MTPFKSNSNTLCRILDDPWLFFCTFFGFPTSSAYLNLLQKWLYDFEIHLHTEDNWRTRMG